MTHPQATFWCAGPARTRREIEACSEAILEVTGESPKWFRAPVGHRNLFTHPVTDELGMKVMGWSRRGFDAIAGNPRAVLARILPVTGGDIVLMHEGTGFATEVLDGILEAAGPAARADLDGNRA
jgi:peptidoglycan/xylan/chitin deacetylase (PgdA/CDA1 family)